MTKKRPESISQTSHPYSNNLSLKPENREAFAIYPNGDTYEGFLRKFKRHGFGLFISKPTYAHSLEDNEYEYEGEWKNDLRDGYGVQRYADGSTYEGLWVNDKQTDGILTWKDQSYYKGQFEGSYFQGDGILATSDEIIRGQWKKSKLDGQGERILLADNSRYIGKWVQGKLTGHGEFHSPEETYVGHFYNNLEHGSGKKIYQDGTEYTGKWRNGLPHGYGKHISPDGTYYKGHYEEGLRSGQGTYETSTIK